MCTNNFISKTTWRSEKMTDEEKQTLTSLYKQNPIFWDNGDSNYRNKVKRSLIKVKLVTLFVGIFSEEFLEKCFHSLRTSMIQEIKRTVDGDFDFLVGSVTKKKNEIESVEIKKLIDFYIENEPLWNHHLKEYRDRNLQEANLIS